MADAGRTGTGKGEEQLISLAWWPTKGVGGCPKRFQLRCCAVHARGSQRPHTRISCTVSLRVMYGRRGRRAALRHTRGEFHRGEFHRRARSWSSRCSGAKNKIVCETSILARLCGGHPRYDVLHKFLIMIEEHPTKTRFWTYGVCVAGLCHPLSNPMWQIATTRSQRFRKNMLHMH